MGVRTVVFSPGKGTPAGEVADVEITADYGDLDAIQAFAEQVDAITYEFGLIDGKLALTDEIHTPDSSRYWIADTWGGWERT